MQAYVLEACLTVGSYQEQPVVITYTLGGVVKTHVPDFEARSLDGRSLIIENKDDDEARTPRVIERTQFMIDRLGRLGIAYRLITRAELDCQPALDNARFLKYHAASICPPSLERDVMKVVIDRKSISLRDALAIDPSERLFQGICRMALLGSIDYPRNQPITLDTVVRAAV
ncbi:hypothetical protein [Motiliproteus sediminis]|uniref:hypothetical protein n=1 Tax=Motiliproteus sediminis TaxID=1468178 RepID=UPI001AF00FA1|nr:hypothetical protein [Motiliproteus sediminis]